ncbi:SGNH/GDSL hydrolase family protein [Pseudoduganella namucuonensis]|uniref:Lysophospholipase L1 n=1 Tax=Pseudoduganella namucuonensis TaxID=1035707 RepID=A0A1I7EVC7_9BURK|nr:SGNH/GDSL hydrolase family protein [Pseudoduganella namucuonensis]SFU27876.1 Lysophospholipase L1 [Pseudoduganella namucuonensis]
MFKSIAALGCAAALALPAAAQQWRTSWYAAPQPVWDAGFALPTGVPVSLRDQTVRETLRLSTGGERLRVVLSNRYGLEPLVIGEARVSRAPAEDARPATRGGGAAASGGIAPDAQAPLTFGGSRSVTIAPGREAVSDALDFRARPLERLSVSTYFPERAAVTTFHWGAQQTGFVASGNVTAEADMAGATELKGRVFLSAVQVEAPRGALVVTLGDSITDGNGSTPDRDRRWPDYLAARLAPRGVAVANAGISGARVLADGMGERAAARFERDVLSQPGVTAVVIALGINDIGWPGSAFAPHDPAMDAATLAAGYMKLIARARERKVMVIGATMAPFENALQGTPLADHYSPAKDAVRRKVNDWIRDSGAFDAVVDFDKVLRDPRRPARLLPAYDSGDHLHPGDAGYEAMAAAAARLLAPAR